MYRISIHLYIYTYAIQIAKAIENVKLGLTCLVEAETAATEAAAAAAAYEIVRPKKRIEMREGEKGKEGMELKDERERERVEGEAVVVEEEQVLLKVSSA